MRFPLHRVNSPEEFIRHPVGSYFENQIYSHSLLFKDFSEHFKSENFGHRKFRNQEKVMNCKTLRKFFYCRSSSFFLHDISNIFLFCFQVFCEGIIFHLMFE